jgi:hypothetical protein
MFKVLERFLISATPTWRILLAAFASTPFFLIIGFIYLAGLWDAEVRGTLHLGAMLACLATFALATVLSFLLIFKLWPRRDRPDPVPGSTLFAIELIGMTFAAMSISIGVLTTSAAMVLMGVLAVGIWLFDQRNMVLCYISVNAAIIFHDVGVLLHWWPYAPALTSMTYASGASSWWFTLIREALFVCGWAALITFLWILIGSLESITEQLASLSNTDGLTGLANRRAFMDVLTTEIDRQSRTGQPLCIVLIDADHFKRVNDVHGHMEGLHALLHRPRLPLGRGGICSDLAGHPKRTGRGRVCPLSRLIGGVRVRDNRRPNQSHGEHGPCRSERPVSRGRPQVGG